MRFFLAFCLLIPTGLFAPVAEAETDARLQVSILPTEQPTGRPDVGNLAKSALPLVLDRLIPVQSRGRANGLPMPHHLLSRVVPGQDQTLVEFNARKVFNLLQRHQIPSIMVWPKFSLILKVQNQYGSSMQQSEQLLYERAADIATRWGIQLADNSPSLVISWRWLSDMNQMVVMVRGNSRLQEYSETRQLGPGDPLDVVASWLQEIMLRARDAYATDNDTSPGLAAARPQPTNITEQRLVFDRFMSLGEQAVMEAGLRSDSRVSALIPVEFSAHREVYRLLLKDSSDDWLVSWFARRGMVLQRTSEGWLGH